MNAHAFKLVDSSLSPDARRQYTLIVNQTFHPLQRSEDLDQPGIVIVEYSTGAPFGPSAEFFQLGIGKRCAESITHIHSPEWAYTIHPLRIPKGSVVREFQVAPSL